MSIFSKDSDYPFLYYFEKISEIPRVSGHTEAISNFLCDFAKEENLSYTQDELHNVVIRKGGQKCKADVPCVILQGHMDMVGDKTTDSTHDFLKDPIKLILNGDELTADGTTLGGDDGVAVAMMMAVLADRTISHPPIECIFTVDEEIGLLGAAGLDMSMLKGRIMINLDSEDEGILTAGCAGGMTVNTSLPVKRIEKTGITAKVVIDGLKGGHSGQMINMGRANAIKLMGRLISELKEVCQFSVSSLNGGQKDNVIPFNATADILFENENQRTTFKKEMARREAIYKAELAGCDDGLEIKLSDENNDKAKIFVMEEMTLQNVLTQLLNMPYGVIAMEKNLKDLVETSSNVGVMRTTEGEFKTQSSVRSSILSKRDLVGKTIMDTARTLGGTAMITGPYPSWEFKKESPLRDLMASIWKDLTGRDAVVEVIHAGLECGLFYNKLPGLDAVSIGPDMKDIHTFSETLSISSAKRNDDFVRRVLASLAG